MDANGRAYGDPGYDESTEQGYQPQDTGGGGGAFLGKVGAPAGPTDAELWLRDHPAQPLAPIDYSSAPGWWNEGQGGGEVLPTPPQLPTSPTQSGGRMVDYIGNVGGRSGVVNTAPLAAALRGAAPATGGSNG